VTASEAVRAFDLERFIAEARTEPLAGIVEGETDATILTAAWGALFPGRPMPFSLHDGKGAKTMQSALNNHSLAALAGDRRVVAVFDLDGAYDQWNGVWPNASDRASEDDALGLLKRCHDGRFMALLLPVPAFRSGLAGQRFRGKSRLSIELLFADADIPPEMIENEEQAGGGNVPVFRDTFKKRFAEHVKALPTESFEAFRPLFAQFDNA